MTSGSARIISFGENGITAAATGSRMSTTEGNALSVFEKGGNREKDLKLIGKVLSSGHNTVIEHAYFNIAFNDVSVLAEQLMIEHRLAAYTVKSRRYVNFSGAGYMVPQGLNEQETAAFRANMDALFDAYNRLTEMGVPCEDARFVLPYCFRSNFIMSVNARELGHIINEMTAGRLSSYPEMVYLGEMIKSQVEELFPGMVKGENAGAEPLPCVTVAEKPAVANQSVDIIASTAQPEALLKRAAEFAGHGDLTLKEITRLPRPRELEMLNYTFEVKERSWRFLLRFVLNITVCYLIAYGVAKPLVRSILSGCSVKLQENGAMLVGMGLFVMLNYIGQRFFAFKQDGSNEIGEAAPEQDGKTE